MGRYITLAPPVTIWWRCAIGVLFLYLYCKWAKIDLKFDPRKDGIQYFISSFLLVGHWVTYFYSLHFSNVAIAFITLYTYPAITAVLEPLFLKMRLQKIHLILGLMVLVGVLVMTPSPDATDGNFMGILIGLFSALLFALRNIYSRDLALSYNGSHLILIQLIIGTLILIPVLFIFDYRGSFHQWEALLFLGAITTAAGHTLFIRSFRHFSVTTASLLASIIPIYGIILAFLILNEVPGYTTILGGIIILSTVVIETLRVSRD
jgi:drug/metabolite transporter (DMT)-like permease